MPFTRSFDTVGWFTRDGALLEQVAAASGCPQVAAPTRLLLPVDVWAQAEPATVTALAPALAQLQAHLGPAEPVVLAPEGLTTWKETFRICQAAEIWDCLGPWVTKNTPDFGPGIRERFEIAANIEAETWAEARLAHDRVRARMAEVVTSGTVLVLPTSPGPAPLIEADQAALDDFRQRAFAMLCAAGLSGYPQLSAPAGEVEGGPVGISLLGAPDTDRGLIALAQGAGLGA